MQVDRERVASLINDIEAEMQRNGMWQTDPLRPEQLQFTQAFGMDTMAYSQRLQFIFLPRVREAITTNSFPSSSSVGTQAIREFDTVADSDRLVSLLCEFDSLFR